MLVLPLVLLLVLVLVLLLELVLVLWLVLGATSLLLVAAKALPSFDQYSSLALALLLPINLGFAAAHLFIARER